MTARQFTLVLLGWGCETVETKKTARKPWDIEDGLWERVESLLPVAQQVRELGIVPVIARRGTDHGSGLGVSGGLSKLPSRCCTGSAACASAWEIRDDIHEAFLRLGCAVICWRRMKTSL